MLCFPGVPGIYYHSLVGSENDREAALASGINRRINRKKLDVEDLSQKLKDSGCRENQIFTKYRKMLRIRGQEPVFNPYKEARFLGNNTVFIIERSFNNDTLYALHNYGASAVTVPAMAQKVTNLWNGSVITEADWRVPAFGFKWIKNVGP